MSSRRQVDELRKRIDELTSQFRSVSIEDPDEMYAFGLWVSDMLMGFQSLIPKFVDTADIDVAELTVDPSDFNSAARARAKLDSLVPDLEDLLERELSQAGKSWQTLAGMLPSVTRSQISVAFLARVADLDSELSVSKDDWSLLAAALGSEATTWLEDHSRFMRSMHWRDKDYLEHSAAFLKRFVLPNENLSSRSANKSSPQKTAVAAAADMFGLRAWLEVNEPAKYRQLYGNLVDVNEVDLGSLPNSEAIYEHLTRLRNVSVDDPRLRIGSMKDLIESTAKIVVTGSGGQPAPELPALINQVHTVLEELNPKAATSQSRKRIRGGLKSIVLGVAEMRNAEGSGHGRLSPTPAGLKSDAELVVDAGTVWINAVLRAWQGDSDLNRHDKF